MKKTGIDKVWETIENFITLSKDNNYFEIKRKEQAKYWMFQTITEALKDDLFNNPKVKEKLQIAESQVLSDKISSFAAAKQILDFYKSI